VIGAVGAPRVALWGYSDGAHVAAAVAQRVPDRIAAMITTGWIADMGTSEERAGLIQFRESSGMCGHNLMLEREERISLPPWMSEQFLATDPKVVAAEVKGFGDGEQVRPLAWCAPRRCSWSDRQRTPKGRQRRWRRSCRQEELSPCRALGTSERSSRTSALACAASACEKASRPETRKELHPAYRVGRIEVASEAIDGEPGQ
jgi:pimeloyl-ACP methyl ester carboxylesterase